jgi:phage gp29-like protein
MDVPRIIEEMMDAVAYGFSPLEVLWKGREDGRWGIDNIVGKPPQWFEFDRDNNLALKNGINTRIELPENRILLVQHRPSYANPYGEKIFSKVFWPVTFKKKGFQWWTVFVEKYGSPFMFGTYPSNAGQEFKDELLRALEAMASNSVAAVPEGSTITISGADDKGGSNNAYHSYLQTANAEISKAILGETLTTEIGETGSYAAAKTHNEVREHIAVADRRSIAGAFSRLAAVYCFYNFGEETAPPRFEFIEDEDLKIERARRDAEICKTTWRPTRDYFIEKYGMDPKHFTLADEDAGSGESEAPEEGGGFMFMKRPADCTCGYRRPGKKNLLQKAALLFASRGERDAERARGLTAEFENEISGEAQKETDALIDGYIDALGLAHDYDEAREVLVSHYEKNSPARCAALIGEGRYAAGQIGAWSVKKRGKRRG